MIFLDSLFLTFAESSLHASVALALFLLLRPWLRRWIGSRWLAVLWVLLLTRLLLPFAVSSPWGVLPGSRQVSGRVAVETMETTVSVGEKRTATLTENAGAMLPPPAYASTITARQVLTIGWVLGIIFGVGRLAMGIRKTRRLAAGTLPATDARLLAVFHAITPELRGNVRLRMTGASDIPVPTLAGSFRPQIWIPREWPDRLTPDEMRHVLLHELGHARRHDLLTQNLFALALCLHWFNPLVWLAARYARQDREMACDAWVLVRMDETDLERYGMTLIRMSQWLHDSLPPRPGMVTMASGKENLTMRIQGISKFSPASVWRGLTALTTMAALLASLTTTTTAKEERDASVPQRSTATATGSGELETADPQVTTEILCVTMTESAERDVIEKASASLSGMVIDSPLSGFAGVLMPEDFAKVKESLTNSGADMLSTPKISARLEQSATMKIARQLRYATEFKRDEKAPYEISATAFDTQDVGLSVTTTSSEADDGIIQLHFIVENVELLGFNLFTEPGSPYIPVSEKKQSHFEMIDAPLPYPKKPFQPVFNTRRLESTVSLWPGQVLVFRLKKSPPQVKTGEYSPEVLWVFATVTYPNAAEGEKFVPTKKTLTGVAKDGDGTAFILDPDAPDAGKVDITGFKKGMEIKSPFTGKVLPVP